MSRRWPITFVTFDQLPMLDPDDRLVATELERRGVACGISVWDQENINWSEAGLCVVRSTWDYHLKYELFQKWITKVSNLTAIENSAALLRWNSDKRYLLDLERKGVPIIPTTWFEQGESVDLDCVLEMNGYRQAVIKPTIGLSTYGVKSVTFGNFSDKETLNDLLRKNAVMMQPFIGSVNSYGERGLVYINGQYAHTIRKMPFQHAAVAGEAGEQAVHATDEERRFALSVLSTLSETPLYARVDIVKDDQGEYRLMELELMETSLYMSLQPQSISIFADAIMQRIEASGIRTLPYEKIVPSSKVRSEEKND